jgi:hypothetical protein
MHKNGGMSMLVNRLDLELLSLFECGETPEEVLTHHKVILHNLCDELKRFFNDKITGGAVESILNDCLHLATRSIEDETLPWWDADIADDLLTIVTLAEQSREYRKAVSWGNSLYHTNTGIRLLVRKSELEYKKMFLHLLDVQCLDTLAQQILAWLNTRNSIITAYENR